MDGFEGATQQTQPLPGTASVPDAYKYDFFVSYSKVDRPWAEWIAWTLEEAGHSTIIQDWDCLEGMDFVDYMLWAREHSGKTLALLSEDYLNSPHCMEELKAAYVDDPSNELRRLVQFRVRLCTPRILPARVYGDLFDKDEADARRTLLRVFGTRSPEATDPPMPGRTGSRRKPEAPPPFPGTFEARPRDEETSSSPERVADERVGSLAALLLYAYILLLSLGTLSVCVAYFLGSRAFQDRPEDAYWDRMFNFNGDPEQYSAFGFGQGLIIEVLRQVVFLFFSLIAMPLFTFKESARQLFLGTPARKLLGIGPAPGGGEMSLDARMEFLLLIVFLLIGFVGVQFHHFYQGPQELWNTEGYRDGKVHDFDVQLVASTEDASAIPSAGEKLVIVTRADHKLDFHIFDNRGNKSFVNENTLIKHGRPIDTLKNHLHNLWPRSDELSESEKAQVIEAVIPAVRPLLIAPPRLSDWGYWKTCLIPYIVYWVYSSINYMAGAAIILTLSIHAGISDLLWMNRWSSDFRERCEESIIGVVALHRRFEREFLVRLGAVLDRYYALAVLLLTGVAFKLWLDRINLSPRAYEFEFYLMAIASVPVITAYLISTVFYRGAAESAARQAMDPEVFRSQHRMADFYFRSIKRSVYLPIALLLLVSIGANLIWELAMWLFRR